MPHQFAPLTNPLSLQLPNVILILSAILATLLLILSLKRINWHRLNHHPFTLHAYFIWIITLTLFSFGRTGVLSGLNLHLYALTAATLMMGRHITYTAALLSQILLWILGSEPLVLLGWNTLLYGALPIWISEQFCRLIQKLLPSNPFIFVLGSGFFGGIITMLSIMLSVSLCLWALDIYPLSLSWDKYLKFLPIIVYPEGFINGVIITTLVAFHPSIISAFDPDRYFINKPPKS